MRTSPPPRWRLSQSVATAILTGKAAILAADVKCSEKNLIIADYAPTGVNFVVQCPHSNKRKGDSNPMSKLIPLAAAAFACLTTFSSTADYAKKLTMTVNPSAVGQGTADVANVPVAIRLSESISDFSYSDFQETNGGDLLFTDESGNTLAHEIEKWDTSGESVIWVKMPTFGPGCKLYAYYGGPANAQNAVGVWGDYVGVWHMAEASGTVADATGNGLDAVPAGDDTTQSVATAGPVGNARVNATDGSANRLSVAYDAQLNLGSTLSFSGWAMLYGKRGDGRMVIVTRKTVLWGEGWNVSILPDTSTGIGYWGKWNEDWGCLAAQNVPDLTANWVHVAVTYNGNTGYMYINGEKWATVRQSDWTSNTWIREPSDNENPLTFGYTVNGNWDDGWSRPFKGAFDEFRLSDDVLGAARIKAEYVAQTSGAFLYEVSEMAVGQATLLSGTTYAVTSADGHNTLCVTGTITSVLGDSAKVFLAVGVAEPKDGDPALRMVGIATNTVTGAGETAFTWDGAILGTKVAFALMNVVEANGHVQTNASATTVITLQDSAEYFWKAGETGYWSDSTKWTTSANDGLPRLGYPSYGSRFQTRWGSQTAEIFVDAAYTGLQGGTTLGWRNDNITFRGTVPGASIGYPEGSGFGDGQYDNTHITLDGVALTCGSYHIYHDSSLEMLNGASLDTRWEFLVDGENASLYVGDGCLVNQRGVDGNRFQFSGENASIVISNGLVRANSFRFGARNDSDTGNVGKTPAGIRFEGESPRLLLTNYANIPLDIGADIPVVFCIPANGYASAPIAKDSDANRTFADRSASVTHGLSFSVDRASPFFGQTDIGKLTQPLVDWTYNNTAYGVNTDAISFAQDGKAVFAFTPAESATKSAVVVELKATSGFSIIFR